MAKPTKGSGFARWEQLMNHTMQQPPTRWKQELRIARQCARIAGAAIRLDFGCRRIMAYKGLYDVQLDADFVAQREIVTHLSSEYPNHGIVSEEGTQTRWSQHRYLWAVDPLDGSNNFGYGIAHCAVAISLFEGDSPALAVIFDPIVGREFTATQDQGLESCSLTPVALEHATVSLVTDYSPEGREQGQRLQKALSECKRVLSLWAPSLDLALVAQGAIDGMICHRASFLDVCGGMFLVRSAGGAVLDLEGEEMEVRRSLHRRPVSFVAARDETLARKLLGLVSPLMSGE